MIVKNPSKYVSKERIIEVESVEPDQAGELQEVIKFDKVQKEYSHERLGFGSSAARNLKYTLVPYKVDLNSP